MLPSKKYTPEDYVRIAWARKQFILIPAVLIASATFTWSYFLPNRYRSQTTILVVPQRVPESYVKSTVTAGVSERLHTISQQILSRTRLERIVEEFNLYERERKTMIMEDVIERMRVHDIDVGVNGARFDQDTSSFTVSFEASNPRTAMLVTERLASMFVQENLQDREVLAQSTSQFLQSQMEDARRRLIDHERKFEAFRRRNAGQLPSQLESNLQIMQTTQVQLQANAETSYRDRDRLMFLDQQIQKAVGAAREVTAPPVSPDVPAGTATQQLEAARAGLRGLELRLKPEHPDISRAKRLIAELEIKAEQEAQERPVNDGSDLPAVSSSPGEVVDRINAMRVEADEIGRKLELRKQEDERLKGVLAQFAQRLETAPSLESELTELTRDYSTLQEQYATLLRKSEESRIAANLERRQIGQQFRVIDGARMPERPISPDRIRINLGGIVAGLLFGLALAALLEYRDTTLKTDDDVAISLALPVMAVIPAMLTARERRRIKRRRVALAVGASVLLVSAVAWQLRLLDEWMR